MTWKLEDFGYQITSNSTRSRRIALGKAVRKKGFKTVKKTLQSRKYRATDYKAKRYQADLNWLKKRKNKYSTSTF